VVYGILAQNNLKLVQYKLEKYNDSVWQQISQMALPGGFIGDFKKKEIGDGYQLTAR